MNKSNKILNDKYYSPISIANKCWEKLDNVIGLNNVSEIIEPSVGNGSFCHYEKRKPDVMIDIEPEIDGAIKSDYIEWAKKQEYKKGRLVIGNPPFGNRNHLSQMFMKWSCKIADYVAFILPINQLNNSYSFARYGFDLIHSEDLGEQEYSSRKLQCCFNIYKRPENGIKKVNKTTSSDIKIYRNDKDIKFINTVAGGKTNKKYDECLNYDLEFVYWGNGCASKSFLPGEEHKKYAGMYKICIDDKNKDKKKIINFIRTFNWKSLNKSISMCRISKQDILNELAKHFDINQSNKI